MTKNSEERKKRISTQSSITNISIDRCQCQFHVYVQNIFARINLGQIYCQNIENVGRNCFQLSFVLVVKCTYIRALVNKFNWNFPRTCLTLKLLVLIKWETCQFSPCPLLVWRRKCFTASLGGIKSSSNGFDYRRFFSIFPLPLSTVENEYNYPIIAFFELKKCVEKARNTFFF